MKNSEPSVGLDSLPDMPPPSPQLPLIANYYFQPEKLENYSFALADLLCWMDGFLAAGGVYTPCSLEVIRDLSCAVKSVQQQHASGDSLSHKKTKTPKTK